MKCYEGKVWKVDYRRSEPYPNTVESIIVLAETMDEAQGLAWQELHGTELIGMYVMTGVRGAVYEVKK